MARALDGRVDDALRAVSSGVAYQGEGTWTLSLDRGEAWPARARVSNGWLELTAPLSSEACPDVSDLVGLEINSRLQGSTRVVRHFGERDLQVTADACLAYAPDVLEFVRVACEGVADAVHHAAAVRDGLTLPAPASHRAPVPVAEIERACAESGWRVCGENGSGVRVDLPAQGAVCGARFDCTSEIPGRFVVELADFGGQADVCRRAVAAMLLALSGSMRLVKGGILGRNGTSSAVVISAPECAGTPAIDRSLSALAVACRVSAREIQALLDERVASEYLARSRGTLEVKPHPSMEEETCLQ